MREEVIIEMLCIKSDTNLHPRDVCPAGQALLGRGRAPAHPGQGQRAGRSSPGEGRLGLLSMDVVEGSGVVVVLARRLDRVRHVQSA